MSVFVGVFWLLYKVHTVTSCRKVLWMFVTWLWFWPEFAVVQLCLYVLSHLEVMCDALDVMLAFRLDWNGHFSVLVILRLRKYVLLWKFSLIFLCEVLQKCCSFSSSLCSTSVFFSLVVFPVHFHSPLWALRFVWTEEVFWCLKIFPVLFIRGFPPNSLVFFS